MLFHKGLIVLDKKPGNCKECDICNKSRVHYCPLNHTLTSKTAPISNKRRPEGCPIISAPEYNFYQNTKDWQDGWNACVYYILTGNEPEWAGGFPNAADWLNYNK